MRVLIFAIVALAAACSRPPQATCDLTLTRDLAFTAADARDTVTVRTFGASCDRVIGLYTVHDAEGYPLWAWSAPMARAFGDETFAQADAEAMTDFLQTWANPTLATTQAAPEWNQLAPGQSTLDQLTYDDIRARDLPMLCHFSGTAHETCVFWEPIAGGAGHLFDRTTEETTE